MYKCSFCDVKAETDKLPEGWGKARLQVLAQEIVDITFCPLHQSEAEEKLDLAFSKDK